MATLFSFLILIFLFCLILGLIKPSIFNKIAKRHTTRTNISLICIAGMLFSFLLFMVTHTSTEIREDLILPETKKIEDKTIETKTEMEVEIEIEEVSPETILPKTTPKKEILEDKTLIEDTLPSQEEIIEKDDFKTEDPKTEPKTEEQKVEEPSIRGKWYTSSHHTAKYYYHESCQGWQGLSPTYLKVFNSEAELLSRYNRTLHPDCKPK